MTNGLNGSLLQYETMLSIAVEYGWSSWCGCEAGGLKRPPLLLFGLDVVLVVDLRGLLLYNNERPLS